MTVKDRTGAVVRTSAGGEARGLVKAGWDGTDANGRNLADGGYTWELTAVPADGSGPELRRFGEVFLTHGGLGTYELVAPARLLDTRSGLGAAKAEIGPGGTVTLQVAGRGGVASGGVSAVVARPELPPSACGSRLRGPLDAFPSLLSGKAVRQRWGSRTPTVTHRAGKKGRVMTGSGNVDVDQQALHLAEALALGLDGPPPPTTPRDAPPAPNRPDGMPCCRPRPWARPPSRPRPPATTRYDGGRPATGDRT